MFLKNVKSLMSEEVIKVQKNLNFSLTDFKPYTTNIKTWLKPVVDLSEFYVYPTNGITEGLNWWISSETRTIKKDVGDYEWVDSKLGIDGEIYYMSNPSSKDGNYREIPTDIPVALDLAYIGTTSIKNFEIPKNVEFVFYSLSKSFGVNGARTGWFFTRKRDIKLHRLIYKSYYYNYYASSLSEAIFYNFNVDYSYKTYYNKQKEICNRFDLTPSQCVWLAQSDQTIHESFKRADHLKPRLCLTEYYKNE